MNFHKQYAIYLDEVEEWGGISNSSEHKCTLNCSTDQVAGSARQRVVIRGWECQILDLCW